MIFMKITVNGSEKELNGIDTLFDLIEQVTSNGQRLVAEVNGEIVRNPLWSEIKLNDGDRIELVTFVGGG